MEATINFLASVSHLILATGWKLDMQILHTLLTTHHLPTDLNGTQLLILIAANWTFVALGCFPTALVLLICGYRKTALLVFGLGVVMTVIGLRKATAIFSGEEAKK